MKRFLLMILFFVSLVFLPYSVYAENLITNGSFETPQITSSENWQIFTEGYGPWVVEGKPDEGEPQHALEYQKNGIYLGSITKDGVQYVELDGYYPVTISQSIQSCSSGKYHVSFDYAPRPGQPENKLLVKLGDTTILDVSETPVTPFAWKTFSEDKIGPTTGTVILSFKETGANDQLGMFLDNVKVECVIPPDEDKDGIIDEKDFCLGTKPDSTEGYFTNQWGVHRWHWDGSWTQQPNPKGKTNGGPYSMEYTQGCSCKQILDKLKAAGLGEFGGHYKFGCSTSILEDFHKDVADGKIDGMYYVESISVPGNLPATAQSSPTVLGTKYILKASGTYRFAQWGIAGIADAMYSLRVPNQPYSYHSQSVNTWVNGSVFPGSLKDYLKLWVNGSAVPWVGSYSDHLYTYNLTGTGAPIGFSIKDDNYGDNSGSLMVDIFAQL